MAYPLFVDGFDMTQYCPKAGYEVSYEVVDGGQGGFMLDGSSTVDELAVFSVIEVPCYPLTEAQMLEWFSVLSQPSTHIVNYYDPSLGQRTITAKRTLPKVKYRGVGGTGRQYWSGAKIVLREVSKR